jgi:AraC family transcriptional regulator
MVDTRVKTNESAVAWLEPSRIENGKAMLIAGLRGHFTSANWDGIPAQWQRLGTYGKVPGQVGLVHYGLCFNLADGIDYLCGFEVSSAAGVPAEFSTVTIPAQKYAVFSHREHVSKLRDTLDAIGRKWLPASGYESARPTAGGPDFFERYGEFSPRTGMGDIEVWLPIKP